jgi:MoxR-like ATPase
MAWANRQPWWSWFIYGAVAILAVRLIKKSGLVSNPDEETKFDVASKAAAIASQANIPVILWGPPGIGKTEWIIGLGELMGVKPGKGLEIVIGSTRDPADIAGILMPDGELRPPRWAREIHDRSSVGERSLLFMDEFSSMVPMVHAALLRVVRDKVAGDTDLEGSGSRRCGECVSIVMAANKPGEGASSQPLPPPAANRIIHINWPDPDKRAWVRGLLGGWDVLRPDLSEIRLPKDWKRQPELQKAKQDIADFISTIGMLSSMPEKGDPRLNYAWPSPRSWDNAALALGAARTVGASKAVQNMLVAGAVGQAQADEFFAFNEQKDLPDPEDLLRDPTSWSPPASDETVRVVSVKMERDAESGELVERTVEEDRPIKRNDILFAVIYSVVEAVRNKLTIDRWRSAWEVLMHLQEVTGQTDIIIVGSAGLMKMVGKHKDLTWPAIEPILVTYMEEFEKLFKAMEKAKILPKGFGK